MEKGIPWPAQACATNGDQAGRKKEKGRALPRPSGVTRPEFTTNHGRVWTHPAPHDRVGLRLPGREDCGFQHVCVLPGYNATVRHWREALQERLNSRRVRGPAEKNSLRRARIAGKTSATGTEETDGIVMAAYYTGMTSRAESIEREIF